MEPSAAVAAWDPPRLFAAQNEGWGGSPPMATAWIVGARAGVSPLDFVVEYQFCWDVHRQPSPAHKRIDQILPAPPIMW